MKGAKDTKKSVERAYVDHTYHDYSKVEVTDIVEDYKGIKEELFPAKLHLILSDPKYSHIISWRPHGRAWYVRNKNAMSLVVLPNNFKHDNFDSFIRSANGWGYKRLHRDGPDRDSYYHEMFLRGKPELVAAMTRPVNPGTRRAPNKTKEPDFTEISRKYPLPDDLRPALEPPPIRHTPSPIKRPRSPYSPRSETEPELNPLAPSYGQQHHHGLPPAGPYPPPPHAYYAQPHYYHLHGQAPPYSEPPRVHQPPYRAYHHHTVAHHGQQHYYHPHHHIATLARAAPPPPPSTVMPQAYQFQHQSPCQHLPAAVPAASIKWQPPPVQAGYHQYQHHPPPSNEHETQQSKMKTLRYVGRVKSNESTKIRKIMPVIHTNQDRFVKASNASSYWDQSHTSAERGGTDYGRDDRKPAAAQGPTTLNRVPAQHTTWNDPNLEDQPPSIMGGLELHSSSVLRSWQHPTNDFSPAVHAPRPEQSTGVLAAPPAPEMRLSPSDNYTALPGYNTASPHAGHVDYLLTNVQRYFSGANDEGEEHNPLDIDNFYSPGRTELRSRNERVLYPTSHERAEEDISKSPPPYNERQH